MNRTTERHWPDQVGSAGERGMDVRHRYAYELVRDFAQPQHRLLDVGSGEGYGATIVRDWIAAYRGIDVSADSVAHARSRYGDSKVQFDGYSGATLPYPDASFDIVTSFQVIEHVDDVELYLKEIRRVAAADAHVLITTPNRTLRLAPGERPWNRYHLREFDAHGLQSALLRVFSQAAVLGIRGSDAMERLERARVERARRFAKIDRLGLRYLLPEAADNTLRRLLRPRTGRGGTAESSFSVADMWRTSDELDIALDLLAIAQP